MNATRTMRFAQSFFLYREVTGEPGFADFAAQHSLSKICQRLTVATAPVLGVSGKPSSVPCNTAATTSSGEHPS